MPILVRPTNVFRRRKICSFWPYKARRRCQCLNLIKI